MTVWLNGRLVVGRDAAIDPSDRGFTLGDGLFETIRVAGGRPRHLARHLARLASGAEILGIAAPSDEIITDAIDALLQVESADHAALRVTLTRGMAARGILPPMTSQPTLLMTVGSLSPVLSPARLIIATVTRRNEHSPLARIKSLNYLDSILARQEAHDRGADDALMLNTHGQVAEATTANLFVRIDGNWLTPPIADGALPGIARSLLVERCGVMEHRIDPETLAQAESAFLSTALSLRGVATIEGLSLNLDAAELAGFRSEIVAD